jgi:hypothetical protein
MLRHFDLFNGEHALSISANTRYFVGAHWNELGSFQTTRFVPGWWEEAIRDAATAIDPNWPAWAGLCFINFEALKVPYFDPQQWKSSLLKAAEFFNHDPAVHWRSAARTADLAGFVPSGPRGKSGNVSGNRTEKLEIPSEKAGRERHHHARSKLRHTPSGAHSLDFRSPFCGYLQSNSAAGDPLRRFRL